MTADYTNYIARRVAAGEVALGAIDTATLLLLQRAAETVREKAAIQRVLALRAHNAARAERGLPPVDTLPARGK